MLPTVLHCIILVARNNNGAHLFEWDQEIVTNKINYDSLWKYIKCRLFDIRKYNVKVFQMTKRHADVPFFCFCWDNFFTFLFLVRNFCLFFLFIYYWNANMLGVCFLFLLACIFKCVLKTCVNSYLNFVCFFFYPHLFSISW